MSAKKQTKSSKKPTKKDKHALSPIEKELLDCCEKRQPVLLYGKDTYRREELVKKIHSLNDGINREWEYEGNKSTKRIDGMREELRKLRTDRLLGDIRRKKLYKDKDYEGSFNKYMLDCNDTSRTYKHVGPKTMGGQEALCKLSCFEYKRFDSVGEFKPRLLEVGSHIWRNHPDRLLFRKQYERSDTKELLWYKGTLFIDKLKCTRGNSKDDECYQELAEKIESLRDIHHSQRGWLVFYTRNLSTFPPEFIEQFEPKRLVSLDGEDAVIKEKQLAKKVLKKTYLYRGEHPDHTFYAVVKGEKKAIEKLSENTQAYTVLYTLYNSDTQRASIDVLISKCKIQKIKGGNHVPARRKKNLQTVISKLNAILFNISHIEHVVKLDDSTEEYYLDINCRD